ncbi:S-protein homolog 74 [Linum grandiflorum]
MSSRLTATVAVVVTILLATTARSSAGFVPRIHMHIVNKMTDNELMLVRCKCSDHDLGDYLVKVGAEFEWSFKKHLIRRTHWRCYLAADETRFMHFDAYDTGAVSTDKYIIDGDINDIHWDVKEDGIYVRDIDSGKDYFAQKWDRK